MCAQCLGEVSVCGGGGVGAKVKVCKRIFYYYLKMGVVISGYKSVFLLIETYIKR